MSGFKAVVLWVPEPRRALANAAIMSFGALGILVATTPTELAVEAVGWRAVFIALAAITFAVATLIFIAVPEQSASATGETAGAPGRRPCSAFCATLCSGGSRRCSPTTAGTHIAIQTLWAGPWLRDVAGLDRIAVANHLMAMAVAFLAGILLSRRGRRLVRAPRRRSVDRDARFPRPVPLLRARDRAAVDRDQSAHVDRVRHDRAGGRARLSVAVLAFRRRPSGRATTAMNLVLFLFAFGAQYAIGAIIDLFPSGPSGGYDPRGYQVGFGVFLAAQVLALVWYLLGRRPAMAAPPR